MNDVMSNGFAQTLQNLRSGYAANELSEKLQELVAGVRLTGRAGELTLKVKVKPASQGDTTALMVSDEINVRMPKVKNAETIFFAGDNNTLLRNDPRQKELALRAIEAPVVNTVELKKVVNA